MLSASGLAALEIYADSQRAYRVFSFGGGVQSTAVLALAAQGLVHYDAFVFSNVGNDSESPATLDYIEQHTKPFAAKHGLNLVEVQKRLKSGKKDTLVNFIERTEKSVPIPARMSNGAPGNRSCTVTFKIDVVDKHIKQSGAKMAVVGLGISTDEFHRMKSERWHDKRGSDATTKTKAETEVEQLTFLSQPQKKAKKKKPAKLGFWKRLEHPLIDLRMSRNDCHNLILDAGLPIPPKSSCFFCPFKKRAEWREMQLKEPELFEKSVAIDNLINDKREAIGRDRVYLYAGLIPLENISDHTAPSLFVDDEMDMCESGYCHT